MVKDEDVCLHCGLCAERCPTAAWDMSQFELVIPYAVPRSGVPQRSDVRDRARRRPRRRQRLRVQDGHGERHRLGQREQLLMQAIFRMGIPVTGKNIFPSNIQGLPTWYEIRVSKDGYTARPESRSRRRAQPRDVREGRRGGAPRRLSALRLVLAARRQLVREGITILGIPFGKMCVESFEGDRNRTLLRNIAYVGALAALLEIDMDIVGELLREKFSEEEGAARRELPRDPPRLRLREGSTTTARCPSISSGWTRRRTASSSTATPPRALGAVYAGATVGAWYPITPSTSLMEAFKEFCERFRVDPADEASASTASSRRRTNWRPRAW